MLLSSINAMHDEKIFSLGHSVRLVEKGESGD